MAWLLTWLVQGLAIALIARVALRALPGLSAATRYAMWWAALVLVLILPIVRGSVTTDARADVSASMGALAASAASMSVTAASTAAAARDSVGDDIAPAVTSPAGTSRAGSRPAGMNDTVAAALRLLPSLPPISLPRAPDWLLAIAIGLWLGFVVMGLAQIAYSVQAVRRLKASCRRMVAPRESELTMWSAVRDRGRAVRVRTSARVRTAAVLGLTRPIIAVPRDAAAALTPHEIDQVVLHEYAHVQRYDDWTKLLQVLIGACFGWHPAVRLMMREIDFEREAACDDYVVDVTGAPRAYARCLTKVIETMPGPGLAAVPHVSSSAHAATTRIERLLDRRRPAGRLAVMPALAGAVTLAALAFCTVHALPIATDHPGQSFGLPFSASLASSDRSTTDMAGSLDAGARIVAGIAGGNLAGSMNAGSLEPRDAGTEMVSAAAAAKAEAAKLTEDDGDAGPASVGAAGAGAVGAGAVGAGAVGGREARRLDLRIAGAGTLPIELPFSRFSPLSRLRDAQLPGSRATTQPPAASTPPFARALTTSPGTSTPLATASASMGMSHVPPPVAARPADRSAAAPAAASAASATSGTSGTSTTPAPRVETNFALGPVASAADSSAMPAASESGHIGRAWENTRDATSKAMGVGARAVGSATKTAGDATKTATNKAAEGVKVSGEKTARAFGRVKRTLASVF